MKEMNANKLKGKLVEKGKSVEWMAEVLNCDRSTAYRKLNEFEKLTIGDAVKLKICLEMNDCEAVETFL